MAHPRAIIRNAMTEHLQGATEAGQRVYAGRIVPLEPEELPAIIVHTREPESVESYPASGWNAFTRRRCIASIECYVYGFDGIDDELDGFADQVETAFEDWVPPGFESGEVRLIDTTSEVQWDENLYICMTRLRYEVTYRKVYRATSNPYVGLDPGSIYRSGAYPGGQVVPGSPASNTGEACPIGDAELFSQEEPIN